MPETSLITQKGEYLCNYVALTTHTKSCYQVIKKLHSMLAPQLGVSEDHASFTGPETIAKGTFKL